MSKHTAALSAIAWDALYPLRIQAVRHRCSRHPLRRPDQLAALGRRLQGSNRLFTFYSDAGAELNFDAVGRLYAGRKSAAEMPKSINDARARMLLRQIRDGATVRTLADQALDPIQSHSDRNHGILSQIRATKKACVSDPNDTEVCRDQARAAFDARPALTRIQWHEAVRSRAQASTRGPGMQAVLPQTAPHLIETSEASSITRSLTYRTNATRRNAITHPLHDLIYRQGIQPSVVDERPLLDQLSDAAAAAAIVTHGVGSRSPAGPSPALPSACAE